MNQIKNLSLIIVSISFIAIIGGAIYEHIAVVPQWSAAPPASLTMLQGEYGLNAAPFWQIIHPVTLSLFILAMVLHRRTARLKYIAWPFCTYFLILVITAVYFVPELLDITQTRYQPTIDPGLQARAAKWEILSLVRLAVLIFLSAVLLSGLAKSAETQARKTE